MADVLPEAAKATEATEDLAAYRASGGYRALERSRQLGPEAVIDQLETAGLRGRGGAAFPTARKWRLVREVTAPKRYLVVNGAEGEPGSLKDRTLMARRPHLVLEGALIAAEVIGAQEIWIYLNDKFTQAIAAMHAAIAELQATGMTAQAGVTFHVVEETHVYLAGEETALIQLLEGKPAQPWHRPPYPTTRGLHGMPTLVNNVETLAMVPLIVQRGATWFREHHPMLFSLTGDVQRPGVYELPLGTPIARLLELGGGPPAGHQWLGVLPGGYSMPLVGPEHFDTPLDYEAMRAIGSGLGASIIAIASNRTLASVALEVASFFARESCGKCPVCVRATQRMAESWPTAGEPASAAELYAYAHRHRHKGICSFLDTASWMTESFLARLMPEVATAQQPSAR